MLSVPREGRLVMLQSTPLQALTTALADPDSRVQDSVCTALQTLADFPQGRTAVCIASLVHCGQDTCIRVMGHRACSVLIACLSTEGEDGGETAASAASQGLKPALALRTLQALVYHEGEGDAALATASKAAVADTVAAEDILKEIATGTGSATGSGSGGAAVGGAGGHGPGRLAPLWTHEERGIAQSILTACWP